MKVLKERHRRHRIFRPETFVPAIVLLSLVLAFGATVMQAHAQSMAFSASLSGGNEVPSVAATSTATTTGSGAFTIYDASSTASTTASSTVGYKLYATSSSPITGAHLHCAAPGSNGPIVATLFSSPAGMTNMGTTSSSTTVFSGLLSQGTLSGSSSLATTSTQCSPAITNMADLSSAIRAGTIYANIHTMAWPNGAARGQLMETSAATTSTGTTTPPATTTPKVTIEIMKHVCPSVHTLAEFDALASTSSSTIDTFLAGVVACPVTTLSGDQAPTSSVAGPHTTFDFSVTPDPMPPVSVSHDGVFHPERICESDVSRDLNKDGTVSSSTCLSVSHYRLPMVSASGTMTVRETLTPAGTHFGTVKFTPSVLDGNNDVQSLQGIDTASSTVRLSAASDTDQVVMLHIYNFTDVGTSTGTSTPTTTPPVITPTTTPSTGDTRLDQLIGRLNEIRTRLLDLIERLRASL